VKQLLEATARIGQALEEAGIPYLVDGSLAVYLHVEHAGRGFANTTRDANIAFHSDGVAVPDILQRLGYRSESVDEGFTIHLGSDGIIKMFHSVESAVANSTRLPPGICVVPVRDLVRAKLERSWLEDKLYVKNLDQARLVTPEIEESLPEILRARLVEIRALP